MFLILDIYIGRTSLIQKMIADFFIQCVVLYFNIQGKLRLPSRNERVQNQGYWRWKRHL